METITFLWIFIAIMFYILYKQIKMLARGIRSKIDSPESAKVVDAEHKIASVKTFIKESKFFEPIAKWKEKIIYRYVYNSGSLYEFLETVSINNSKFFLDDEQLYFDDLSYRRVNNPKYFLDKFILFK